MTGKGHESCSRQAAKLGVLRRLPSGDVEKDVVGARSLGFRAQIPAADRGLRMVTMSELSEALGLQEITKESVDGERKRSDSES